MRTRTGLRSEIDPATVRRIVALIDPDTNCIVRKSRFELTAQDIIDVCAGQPSD